MRPLIAIVCQPHTDRVSHLVELVPGSSRFVSALRASSWPPRVLSVPPGSATRCDDRRLAAEAQAHTRAQPPDVRDRFARYFAPSVA
jgi:hypothetical protein